MFRFIVVEGLIGVGKTTLCRLLEQKMNAELVLEPAEDNPFLASFYADPDRFAFPAQMFYLAARCQQQSKLLQARLFSDLYVSDYLFAKDRLFAEQTLSGDEFVLYDRFSYLLSQSLAKPDLVLFLDSPTEVILNRIKKRAISSEQVIPADYLDQLRARYYKLWDSYNDAPVYVLNTEDIDYVNNDEDMDFVVNLLTGWLEGNPQPNAPSPYRQQDTSQLTLF